ncbi:MAG: two-component regulator propeller domain-containing protein [Candidatus Poribacteria bacterium]|nr:two-component regulator propeller domain-containing protein [Candidatus Poribacteria bacterium]
MKFYLCTLIILSCLTFSYSQDEWRQFTTRDGMSGDNILSIQQSKSGDIWIATDKGLDRFAGTFENYITSAKKFSHLDLFESSTGQLIVNVVDHINDWTTTRTVYFFDGQEWDDPDFNKNVRVSTLPEFAVAFDEKIWLATFQGLLGFDGQNWQLFDGMVGSIKGRIDWLVKTPDGRLWSANRHKGIISFDGTRWNVEFKDNFVIDHSSVNTAYADDRGHILIGTDEGLFRLDPTLNTVTNMGLGQTNISQIYQSKTGHLWVLTDKGLFRFGDNEWVEHLKTEDQTRVFSDILEQSNGEILVGTDNGLFSYNGSQWQQRLFVPVNCIYLLNDGILMVGSTSGLFVFSPDPVPKTALNGISVIDIHQAADGKIWLNSDQSISYFDGREWVHFTEGVNNSGARGRILSDGNGRVWFSRRNGLYVYDNQTIFQTLGSRQYDFMEASDGQIWSIGGGNLTSYDGTKWIDHKENWPDTGSPSWALAEDANGDVWVGGGVNPTDGLYRFDGQKWELVLTKAETGGGIETLFLSSDDTLWAGSWKGGIFKKDKNDDWVQVLEEGHICSFYESENGQLFAVVPSGGLLQWNGETWSRHLSFDKSISISIQSGVSFVEHPVGVYWLATTNSGLMRIEDDSWTFLTTADGLPSNKVYSVAKDSEGNIWAATEFGAYVIENRKHLHPPSIKISRIDDSEFRDSAYVTGRSFVSVTWISGDIQTSAERITYQYKSESLDSDQEPVSWSPLIRENTVTIGLPDGQHRFSVRAIDHHFNVSTVDSADIIVKTQTPYLSIKNLSSGDIISGDIYIKGQVKDDDFRSFQLFISDTDLTTTPILLDDSEKKGPYQLIFQSNVKPRTETLALFRTTKWNDGEYLLWLTAQDQTQHSSFVKLKIRTDNTLPTVEILTPENNQRVLNKITISGVASDFHLDGYRLDYTTDLSSNDWDQIYVENDLYQANKKNLLNPSELQPIEIQREWEIPIKEGTIWIRLLATDVAGNTGSQTVEVEIPAAVQTRKGGKIFPVDQRTQLYFPPNTLTEDAIITVNILPEQEVDLPLLRLSLVYDFIPNDLQLNPMKPATLILYYDQQQLPVGKQPVIYHRNGGAWKIVGGTPDPEQQTITTVVSSLGQYAVVGADQTPATDSASLVPESLICQPRVFSPQGNTFSANTTISFVLDQSASVSIKIYSIGGQLVRWLADGTTFGRGRQALSWNGRDNNQEIVPTGLYIVVVAVDNQIQNKVINIWNH